MPARRRIQPYLCTLLLLSACSSGSELTTKVDESSQGAVYLTRVSDRSFQAAHPIKIDPTVIALVLNGILIRDDQGTTREVRRVFSGSEVGYLAPIISEGLRRAAPDQQVVFRGGPSGGPASPSRSASDPSDPHLHVSPSGVMYAYGRSLYVTLPQYPSRPEAATTANGTVTGSPNRSMSFIPEAAKRADSFLDTSSTGNTLVIDYELLAMLPAASLPSASAPSAPPSQPAVSGGQTDPPKRDAEIEALRKELQEIKKQLAEQEAERARAPRTNPAPQH
jgi:hypothetical protein